MLIERQLVGRAWRPSLHVVERRKRLALLRSDEVGRLRIADAVAVLADDRRLVEDAAFGALDAGGPSDLGQQFAENAVGSLPVLVSVKVFRGVTLTSTSSVTWVKMSSNVRLIVSVRM